MSGKPAREKVLTEEEAMVMAIQRINSMGLPLREPYDKFISALTTIRGGRSDLSTIECMSPPTPPFHKAVASVMTPEGTIRARSDDTLVCRPPVKPSLYGSIPSSASVGRSFSGDSLAGASVVNPVDRGYAEALLRQRAESEASKSKRK